MNTDFKILEDLKNSILELLPTVLGVLIFILVSWILLKIILFLLKRFLKFSQLHLLNEKINGNEFLHTLNFKINLPVVIHKVVKWMLVLIIILLGSELFGLDRISDAVLSFLGYLPTLISAVVILTAGLYLAGYLKETVKNLLKSFDLNGSNSISTIVFFVVLIISVIISLNQLGVNTEIITSNLSIILGCCIISLYNCYGIGVKRCYTQIDFWVLHPKKFRNRKKNKNRYHCGLNYLY